MALDVLATGNHRNAIPVGRPKVAASVTPTGSWQYVVLPADAGQQNEILVVVTASEANARVDIVGLTEDASDSRAVPLRVPAGGSVDRYFYVAKASQRLGYKTL